MKSFLITISCIGLINLPNKAGKNIEEVWKNKYIGNYFTYDETQDVNTWTIDLKKTVEDLNTEITQEFIPKPNPHEDPELKKFVIIEHETLPKPEQLDLSNLDTYEHEQKFYIWQPYSGKVYDYKNVLIERLFATHTNQFYFFKTLYRYKPNRTNNDTIIPKRYAMFICHGTGEPNPDYHDIDTQLMHNFINMAAEFAEKDTARPDIDVIPILWHGENCATEREKVSGLGLMVDAISDYYDEFIFLGYSHGGNIGTLLNNYTNKKFLLNINLASPVRNEEWQEAPLNTNLFNFYSPTDIIQLLGSINVQAWFSWLFSWIPLVPKRPSCTAYKGLCKNENFFFNDGRRHNKHKNSSIANIKFTYDNELLNNHTAFSEKIASCLPLIIFNILSDFNQKEAFFNLSCNYVPEEKALQNNVKPINISLLPPSTLKEKEEYKRICPKIKELSDKNRLEHKKIYKSEKDEQMWCFTLWYYYMAGMYRDIFPKKC